MLLSAILGSNNTVSVEERERKKQEIVFLKEGVGEEKV